MNPSKTNRVIWDFCFHETNPQKESFKNRSTNQIHKTNLLNIVGQNKSTKWIFWTQYGFVNPKPRIPMDSGLLKVRLCTKDSSGFIVFLKTGQILWKSVYESNPRTESFENIKDWWYAKRNESRFVLLGTNRTFLEAGFVTTIRNESLIWFLQP